MAHLNDLITLASFIVLAMLVVTAARLGTNSLFMMSVTFILLSNITVRIPVVAFGVEFPWAVIVYSLVYFIMNLLCEYCGKGTAYRLAATNLAVQVIIWAYVWASVALKPAESGQESFEAMRQLLSTTKQVTVAALLASVGPFLSIWIYARMQQSQPAASAVTAPDRSSQVSRARENVLAVVFRNKVSTVVGQVVNTVIFFSISEIDSMVSVRDLVATIGSSCAVKIVVALADIPFLILACHFMALRHRIRAAAPTADALHSL